MFWQLKIDVDPGERVIVTDKGRLLSVLTAGEHRLSTMGKDIKTFKEVSDTLQVSWSGLAQALRYQRELAEQLWHVVDVPDGHIALVWHRYQPLQVLQGGQVHAFWRPEQGELNIKVLPKQQYWLDEVLQQELLNQAVLPKPLKAYTVNVDERLFVLVQGRLERVLARGQYVLNLDDSTLKVLFAKNQPRLYADTAQLDAWAADDAALIAAHFECVQAPENEVVLCNYQHGLQHIVKPNTRTYFWKNEQEPLLKERISIPADLQLDARTLTQFQAADYQKRPELNALVQSIDVPEQHQAIVSIDHQHPRILDAGKYYFWRLYQDLSWKIVDLRLQTVEVSGQELLSADKVTIRVNVVCHYQVVDSALWVSQYANATDYVYRELQFAVRAVVGSRSIDELLADKQAVDEALVEHMVNKHIAGITIDSMGLKDIILPGEIRQILTKVVEAEKSAQANNIRRREETAATRSLLNTARVMEENPTALRLKELETLEKVTEKIDKISVFGGLDGVLNGLINIQAPNQNNPSK